MRLGEKTTTHKQGNLIYAKIDPGRSGFLYLFDFLTVATNTLARQMTIECRYGFEFHARIAASGYVPDRSRKDPFLQYEGLFSQGVSMRLPGGSHMQYMPTIESRSSFVHCNLNDENQYVGTFQLHNRKEFAPFLEDVVSRIGLTKNAIHTIVESARESMGLLPGSIRETH